MGGSGKHKKRKQEPCKNFMMYFETLLSILYYGEPSPLLVSFDFEANYFPNNAVK